MPIRLMHYVACFYDHLLKAKATTPGKGLPPVFPIVLYNGNPRWTAPQDIYDMVQPEPPAFLKPYQPHLRYYVIDEGAYSHQELEQRHSPLSGIFGIEKASASWESLQQAVDRIVAIIQADPHKPRIDPIITRWVKRHLQRLGAGIHLEALTSLVEDKSMLAENLENLVKKERLEGRREGRLEGRQEGHQEGRQEAEQQALQEKRETVRQLLSFGVLNDEQIALATGLTVNEIVKLRIEDKH